MIGSSVGFAAIFFCRIICYEGQYIVPPTNQSMRLLYYYCWLLFVFVPLQGGEGIKSIDTVHPTLLAYRASTTTTVLLVHTCWYYLVPFHWLVCGLTTKMPRSTINNTTYRVLSTIYSHTPSSTELVLA